jgi:hypothetical protein
VKPTSSGVTLLLVQMRSKGLVRLPFLLIVFYFTFCFVQVVVLFACSFWLPVKLKMQEKYIPCGGNACLSDDGTTTL